MKYFIFFCLTLFSATISFAQQKTVFEKSGGNQTSTYFEAIDFYKELAKRNPEISMKENGMTDSGFPLHLVTVSKSKVFDYDQLHKEGKTVILINNGIHPGEPDGIEASMMLARDLMSDSKKGQLLNDVILVIIPVYNIGGSLNRNSYSRTNQNGPEEYGFRGNAQNLDLNRDFVKMDSKNAKTFAEIFHLVKPDILIDTHVSNGADYQYNITHLATQPDKLGGELGQYLRNEMIPKLEEGMAQKKDEIIPYVNIFNKPPDKEGYTQFMDSPRYASGYTALFNTIGFTIETHMLKPFSLRVPATYRFIQTIMEIGQEDGSKIKEMITNSRAENIAGNETPIAWELDMTASRTLSFKGYEAETKISEVTGFDRLYYNQEKQFEKEIPYYNNFKVSNTVVAPLAYIVPQGWSKAIDYLKINNVELKQFEQDTIIQVEVYHIDKYETSTRPYEAHYPHNSTTVNKSTTEIKFREGDYYVPVNQMAGKFLVNVLEPEAVDSYFNWNFFDTILQQKEYFSPYVFEEIAAEMLKSDPELKDAFEERKKNDADFAKNWYAQLSYIYHQSEHYEEAHLRYPVFRVMN